MTLIRRTGDNVGMDAFMLVWTGVIVAGVLVLLAVAKLSRQRAMDIAEKGDREALGEQVAIENRDIGQMVEGNNEYRRRRGEDELTEEGVRAAIERQELDRLGDPKR
jgi:hypothetical protein